MSNLLSKAFLRSTKAINVAYRAWRFSGSPAFQNTSNLCSHLFSGTVTCFRLAHYVRSHSALNTRNDFIPRSILNVSVADPGGRGLHPPFEGLPSRVLSLRKRNYVHYDILYDNVLTKWRQAVSSKVSSPTLAQDEN